jgi:catechol 2,3-dioxygenase-like lactoylglutathione lyase family enzyme
MPPINHVGLCPADFDASFRFYTEGVGLDVLFDVTLDADLERLIGISTAKVRTVFLGSKATPDVGALELMDFFDDRMWSQPSHSGVPERGACLVSFVVPVVETLDRLASMGLGGEPRVIPTPSGGRAATVVDPDGVVVELLDRAPSFG